jgi:hypothetical protein
VRGDQAVVAARCHATRYQEGPTTSWTPGSTLSVPPIRSVLTIASSACSSASRASTSSAQLAVGVNKKPSSAATSDVVSTCPLRSAPARKSVLASRWGWTHSRSATYRFQRDVSGAYRSFLKMPRGPFTLASILVLEKPASSCANRTLAPSAYGSLDPGRKRPIQQTALAQEAASRPHSSAHVICGQRVPIIAEATAGTEHRPSLSVSPHRDTRKGIAVARPRHRPRRVARTSRHR